MNSPPLFLSLSLTHAHTRTQTNRLLSRGGAKGRGIQQLDDDAPELVEQGWTGPPDTPLAKVAIFGACG